MTVTELNDGVRGALDRAATSMELPGLMPLSDVAPLAERRSRRRQLAGGLATVLLVAMVTVGVGLRPDAPSAVFAGPVDESLVPGVAIAHDGRFVGLAAIDPFELDEFGNVALAVVTSPDGDEWTRVVDSRELIANGALLGYADGLFHMAGIRTSEVVELDGTRSGAHGLLHATSVDLVEWSETVHPLPDDVGGDGFRTQLAGMAIADGEPVVLLSHYRGFSEIDDELETLGRDADEICEFTGLSDRTTIRFCGETETVSFSSGASQSYLVEHELATLGENTVSYSELPFDDDGRPSQPATFQATLYQTAAGIGLASRDIFESVDGQTWQQVDVGREPSALMAARGDERVFRSVIDVPRYRTDDPVAGMGYSSDSGRTWQDIRIDHLAPDDQVGLGSFGDLQSSAGGWVVVARRMFDTRPEVTGVELQADSPFFTVSVDGYEFSGTTPYGPAELRDPTGTVVRSWDHLEVSNPIWSGLEMVKGDVVIRDDLGAHEMVITASQWNVLVRPIGPNSTDVLFSANGLDWQTLETTNSWTRILASNADGVLVQRWSPGNHSETVPPVEFIPFPTAGAD